MVKQIRGDNNNIYTCISDIVDNSDKASRCNVELLFIGDKLHKIIISDNLLSGFEGLNETGIHNPLNMTHDRDGQLDDNISSEFGRGLKVSTIYLGDIADIYTRTDDGIYTHVHFDYPEQMAKEDAMDSFEPTEIESRTVEQYRKNHQFETGSSIVCSSLRTDKEFQFLSKDVCIEKLQQYLQETFSDKIAGGFGLSLNGIIIDTLPNYMNGVPKYTHELFIELNNADQILNIHVKRTHPTGTITHLDRELKSMTELEFSASINEERCEILTMESVTALDTTLMFSNRIRVKRNGRRHGDIEPFKKKNQDGYANHIYNEINYICKRLNQYMGVGANKRISSDKDTPLIQTLRLIQNFTTTSLIKKSEKKVETAEEKQIRILAEQEKESCRLAEEERKQQEKDEKKRIADETKRLKEDEKKRIAVEKANKLLEQKNERARILLEQENARKQIELERLAKLAELTKLAELAELAKLAELTKLAELAKLADLAKSAELAKLSGHDEESGEDSGEELDAESDEEFELAVQLLPVEIKQPNFNVHDALTKLNTKLLSSEDTQEIIEDLRLFMIKYNII